MRIDLKTLKRLSVETVSEVVLGRVVDLEIDIESQAVARYKVRSSLLGGSVYLVSHNQVVDITATKMVVDDAVCRAPSASAGVSQTPKVEPALMRHKV